MRIAARTLRQQLGPRERLAEKSTAPRSIARICSTGEAKSA